MTDNVGNEGAIKKVAILGELDKWAHFSPNRLKQGRVLSRSVTWTFQDLSPGIPQKVENYGSWVMLELFGAINEEIEFTVATNDGNPQWNYETFQIQFDRSQRYILNIGDY